MDTFDRPVPDADTVPHPRPAARRLTPHPQIAPAFAGWIVAVVLVSFPAVAASYLFFAHPSAPVAVASMAFLGALVGIQLTVLFAEHRFQTVRSAVLVLLVQAVLVFTPFAWAHGYWIGTPYYLSASALLLLPAMAGRIVFGCAVVGYAGVQVLLRPAGLFDPLYYFVSVLILVTGLGLAIFGLTRLAGTVRELHATRAELAELAVSQERLRFARDLHDLLSYSLSAISLTGELSYRLIDSQPAAAKRELESVLTLSRQALTDVRAVANSYRHMSLTVESAGAQAVLSAADIEVHADLAVPDGIAGPADAALATVMREAVTNVLRHSDASRCEMRGFVTGGEYRLIVANNGVRAASPGAPATGRPDRDGAGGTGHGNLSERLDAVHGRLDTRVRGDGWFQLTARVPLDPRRQDAAT